MKALRRRDNHEWLAKTLGADLYTGSMPMEIGFNSIEEMTTFYKEKIEVDIDLSDYELVDIVIVALKDSNYTSKSCEGEYCMCCGENATHKIEETIFHDDPHPNRHPLTGYLCDKHFDMVLRPYNDKRNIEQIAKDEWDDTHKFHRIHVGPELQEYTEEVRGVIWQYWLKAFQVAMQMNIPPRVSTLAEKIQAVINSAQFVENSPANDYNHGKHTAANMILDDLNQIFYGYTVEPPAPKKERYSTGIRETEFGVEKGFQPWIQIDHQTFYLQVDEDKEHAQWYLNQTIVALNRLMGEHGTGRNTTEEVPGSVR